MWPSQVSAFSGFQNPKAPRAPLFLSFRPPILFGCTWVLIHEDNTISACTLSEGGWGGRAQVASHWWGCREAPGGRGRHCRHCARLRRPPTRGICSSLFPASVFRRRGVLIYPPTPKLATSFFLLFVCGACFHDTGCAMKAGLCMCAGRENGRVVLVSTASPLSLCLLCVCLLCARLSSHNAASLRSSGTKKQARGPRWDHRCSTPVRSDGGGARPRKPRLGPPPAHRTLHCVSTRRPRPYTISLASCRPPPRARVPRRAGSRCI
jgi:hypothetical protein